MPRFDIHKELGPGLLESVYEIVLARALQRRGFQVERQKPISFEYDGMLFEEGFRTDLLVEGRVVVEIVRAARACSVQSSNNSEHLSENTLQTYDKLTKVRRTACARAWQTTPDISSPDASARRTTNKLRRRHAKRRPAPHSK